VEIICEEKGMGTMRPPKKKKQQKKHWKHHVNNSAPLSPVAIRINSGSDKKPEYRV